MSRLLTLPSAASSVIYVSSLLQLIDHSSDVLYAKINTLIADLFCPFSWKNKKPTANPGSLKMKILKSIYLTMPLSLVGRRLACRRLRRELWEPCICQHNSATFSFAPPMVPTELWHFKDPSIKERSSAGKHVWWGGKITRWFVGGTAPPESLL